MRDSLKKEQNILTPELRKGISVTFVVVALVRKNILMAKFNKYKCWFWVWSRSAPAWLISSLEHASSVPYNSYTLNEMYFYQQTPGLLLLDTACGQTIY